MLERNLLELLSRDPDSPHSGWMAVNSPGHDLRSADGRYLIEIKAKLSDRRAFIASATKLALDCNRYHAGAAYLVLWEARLAKATMLERWNDLQDLFRSDVSGGLRLVSVWPDNELLVPDDATSRWLARLVRGAAALSRGPAPRIDRRYEVLRLLALRLFWNEGPIKIKDLQAETGLSHPTVKRDLDRLGKYVERQSDRSVQLARFPLDGWRELIALSPDIRRTAYYADATGKKPNIRRLVNRLRQLELEHVAFGGVIAAREWQPDFDLDGTPRIDLSVHAPDGRRQVGFLEDVDAALEPTDDPARAVIAVHSVVRARSHFKHHPELGLIADPVETLLDLYELRLDSQAEEFRNTWKTRRS